MPLRSGKPELGRLIVAARLRRGLSQSAVSRRAGMNPSSLSRIEHGRVNPTMAVVLRIARALGLSPAELLAMQPGTEREGACPVSARGQCLLDLIDDELDADPAQRKERYSLRQLRLLRRFALLVRQDDKDLEKALETLLERIRGTGGV